MKKDKYGEVINGFETYEEIALNLKNKNPVIIGWTDEKYTHLDLLFNVNVIKEGTLQRGLRWSDLFVSVMSFGAFGFTTDEEQNTGYIAEKLSLGFNETTKKLTDLINGIIRELNKE